MRRRNTANVRLTFRRHAHPLVSIADHARPRSPTIPASYTAGPRNHASAKSSAVAIAYGRDTIMTPAIATAPPTSIDISSGSPSNNTLISTPNTGTRFVKMLVIAVPNFLIEM